MAPKMTEVSKEIQVFYSIQKAGCAGSTATLYNICIHGYCRMNVAPIKQKMHLINIMSVHGII